MESGLLKPQHVMLEDLQNHYGLLAFSLAFITTAMNVDLLTEETLWTFQVSHSAEDVTSSPK